MSVRIFISYSHEDKESVVALAKALKFEGHEIWYDEQIQGGRAFADEIQKELRHAHVVLVVLTKASVKSRWVREEMEEALNMDKLLPLRIEDCEPPFGYKHGIHFVNLMKSEWVLGDPKRHPEWRKIVAAIAERGAATVVRVGPHASGIEPTKAPKRTWRTFVAFALAICIGASLGWAGRQATLPPAPDLPSYALERADGEEARALLARARDARERALAAALKGNDAVERVSSLPLDRLLTVTPGATKQMDLTAPASADGTIQSYRGEVDGNGEPFGLGASVQLNFADGTDYRYVGEFQRGRPNGFGVLLLGNSERLEGHFVDGVLDGVGVITNKDRSRYEGEISDGLEKGFGVTLTADGQTLYEGQWLEGQRAGRGVAWSDSGRRASLTTWIDDKSAAQ